MNFLQQPPDSQSHSAYFQQQQQTPYPAAHSRAFGSFSADAPPTNVSHNIFSTDDLALLGYDDGGDQGDPKRRRIARACDMCRKKKIKCDGKMPACTHCQNYKTECVFTQVEKKRNPPKGAKYIEGLENRLGRMEALLRLSGLLSDEENGATDLQTLEKRLAEKNAKLNKEIPGSASHSPSMSIEEPISIAASPKEPEKTNKDQPTQPKPKRNGKDEEVEALSEAMCSLVTNNYGDTRYIGSSSGFSIFSPKGVQWVNQKTGDVSFEHMVTATSQEDNKWIQWRPDVFGDIFQRRVYRPLPPKAEALSLLQDYFTHFNCMFPLFHEATFMVLVEKHYSRDPYEGSGWWASLNVALALAHRLRVMSNLVPAEEDLKAWGYLKNALAVLAELTIRNTDLLSIQALLGMSMFLMGTPNPQPSFFLVAAAIRLSHSLGLHKKGSMFSGLETAEIEQRKRVYWIAYMLDKDICLRSGRPPVQDDDDMNVELPSEDPPDNIGNIPLADGKGKVNLFRLMCAFAVIASKVYKSLYSVKAAKQADGELLNTIGELDRELEEWKDSIPIDFRPEHEIKASHTPLILHVVTLHFAYYNCLTTIHRMSVHHGYWTSRLSNYAIQGLNVRPLNPRVFSSAALCVSAARASIHLIKYIPQGDFACVWLILYYPVSSLVTLFANILQNPQDSRARSDLKLMSHVVTFLSMLCTDENTSAVRRMLNICSEFERISQVVLDKSDRESSSRRGKRKQQDTGSNQTSPAAMLTPHMAAATPTPNQPGNVPNVYSPPSALMKNLDSFDQTSPGMTAASLISGDASQSFFSPSNAATPLGVSGSSPGSNPGSTAHHSSFNFSMPSASGMASQVGGGVNGMANSASPDPVSMGSNLEPSGLPDPFSLGTSFQHPFVPQDLWQMPMTLEWDWADMTSGFAGMESSFEANGVMRNVGSPANGVGP